MTQDSGEASTIDRLGGVLTVGLQERHPSLGGSWEPLEPLSCLVQHRRRWIKEGHVVAGLGQRKRLMARPTTNIEQRRRRFRQVLEQLLVQDVRAHVPLHRGVGLIGKCVGQARPGVVAYGRRIEVGGSAPAAPRRRPATGARLRSFPLP
jgi:hypothetical protein